MRDQTGAPGGLYALPLFFWWSPASCAEDSAAALANASADFLVLFTTDRTTDRGSRNSAKVLFRLEGVNLTAGCKMRNSSELSLAMALLCSPQAATISRVSEARKCC